MSDTQNKFDNPEALIDGYVSRQSGFSASGAELMKAINDEKFIDAVDAAVRSGSVGTALIQRRLRIGYGRAAYMIDAMEALGLIGAPKRLQPREVLPAAAEYLLYKSK